MHIFFKTFVFALHSTVLKNKDIHALFATNWSSGDDLWLYI